MRKTFFAIVLSGVVLMPVFANDLEKPPEFKPSAETLERQKKQREAQLKTQQTDTEQKSREANYVFPDGHDPRDHDHDDPLAHQKQLEQLEAIANKDEPSWWRFWE